jgi:hypothetical protein
VTGGRQRKGAVHLEEWLRYEQAILLEVDLASGEARPVASHEPAPAALPEGGSVLFKSAFVSDERMYVCTQTEVVVFSLPGFEELHRVSLPCFNDLHHVRPATNGNLLVVSTGLDMIVEVTTGGERVREWNVLGEDPWGRFSREVDYRQVLTTKPHHAHPNHVFLYGEELWATRFLQKDAVSLSNPGRRIDIGIGHPHDGLVRGDSVFFTTVNGYVVRANLATLEVERVFSLAEATDPDMALGWCRGLEILPDGRMAVGFTRLRPTRFRENLQWMKRQLGLDETGRRPSRIAIYDPTGERLISEVNLEPWGVNVVFSVHFVEEAAAGRESASGLAPASASRRTELAWP